MSKFIKVKAFIYDHSKLCLGHLSIEPIDTSKNKQYKYRAFKISNYYDKTYLGTIEWSDKQHWNCYAFFPACGVMFEKECLRDIANFCEQKTKEEITYV